MSLFQKSVLNKFLSELNHAHLDEKFTTFNAFFTNPYIQENIRQSKEEQFQEGFLRKLFVNVLGYTLNPEPEFNLTTELKNVSNTKKADGAILKNGEAVAVIELKSTNTTDLDLIEAQAFGYKNHHPKCTYVITSNFEKLRFYVQNAVDHIDFDLFHLSRQSFSLLWLCLAKENLLNDLPLKIKDSSVLQEEKITKQLYADYSLFRQAVFQNLIKNNPETDKLLLFKKTQKLLDRFLFIFFAEDRLLLPPNSISEIVKQWTSLKDDYDEYKPLYERFKKYFGYMNTGYKGKKYDIYPYNGGLFAPDEILDQVDIDDDILFEHTQKLSRYDFETDVDVNILGHIFEHSLTEIEHVQAELKGETVASNKTKRKKDGIFYTPKYITKYIVENTVGKLCEEKRLELGIVDEDYAKGRKYRKKDIIKSLDDKLTSYRNWLLSLTILDPACGSGAFLNQALEFLITEHQKIDELRRQLLGESLMLSDITNDILEKNIYGVDINDESVEIAKLSLWLRTAKKGRKLNTLSNNIKCGNSLIDDPEVAGEKAFNWQKEFPQIFTEKHKQAWHVTWVTHDTRISERMKTYKVRERLAKDENHTPYPVYLEAEQALKIAEIISDIVHEEAYNCLAFNICLDHIHMILVCQEDELPFIVRKLKGQSTQKYKEFYGFNGEEPFHLWAQKFNSKLIESHKQLETTIHYIQHNREKHELPDLENVSIPQENNGIIDDGTIPTPNKNKGKTNKTNNPTQYSNKGLQPLVNPGLRSSAQNTPQGTVQETASFREILDKMLCTPEYAFRPEYKGGFDVVIGNPPYVRAELLGYYRDYLLKNYSVFNPSGDLFSYFYEKSFKLLKLKSGLFGFISNSFNKTSAGTTLRDYLQHEIQLKKYVDFSEVQIFEGATTYPVIIIAKNNKVLNNTFDYIKILKHNHNAIIDIDLNSSINISQKTLDKDNWSFKSTYAVNLFKKLNSNKSIKGLHGKCFRGILTGLNEAFIIPKTYSTGKHIKPIYEGKELEKWAVLESQQQLILFESKWTKSTYGADIDEELALKKITKDFPELVNHLLKFEEKAKKRYDKGEFFWELRNCAYYELFEKPKIVFPNLQNSNKFAYDASGAYINAPAVILPTQDKFLTAILNSRPVWYFLKNICVIRNGGYIEVKPQYFEQIPIPNLSNEQKAILNDLVENVINLIKESQLINQKFLDLLKNKFSEIKISKKLESWYKINFKDFEKELKKQKIKLSISESSDWLNFFEERKNKYTELKNHINSVEIKIDQMVYELYGLTEEEIKIVEENS